MAATAPSALRMLEDLRPLGVEEIRALPEAIYAVTGKGLSGLLSECAGHEAIVATGTDASAALTAAGFTVFGGVHAPYIWLRTQGGATSWEFFDRLLTEAQVVGTPGSGFGPAGEGYFRLSGFNSRENIEEAIQRIRRVFG